MPLPEAAPDTAITDTSKSADGDAALLEPERRPDEQAAPWVGAAHHAVNRLPGEVVTKDDRAHQRQSSGQHRPPPASETGRRDSRDVLAQAKRSGRDQQIAQSVAHPPDRPECGVPVGGPDVTEQRGDETERCADRRAPERRHADEQEHVPEPLETAVEARTPQERGADDRLQRVAGGDDRGAPERNPRRGVDGEGGSRDRRPEPQPAQAERGERDAGRRPDGASRSPRARRTTARGAPSRRRGQTAARAPAPAPPSVDLRRTSSPR